MVAGEVAIGTEAVVATRAGMAEAMVVATAMEAVVEVTQVEAVATAEVEGEAVAAVALKSLGRVKKRPNLSLTILLNLMCRILKSLKIRSFRDSTAYIPRYT